LANPADPLTVLQAFVDAGAKSLDLQSIDVLEDGALVVDIGR
jgi:hypothetical protein